MEVEFGVVLFDEGGEGEVDFVDGFEWDEVYLLVVVVGVYVYV